MDVNVVALAPEKRMRLDADGDVQVASRAAVPAGIALPCDSQPRAGLRARRNAHVHGFCFRKASVAVASGADVAKPAFPIATRTSEAEPHCAGHLGDVASSIALGTNGRRAARSA